MNIRPTLGLLQLIARREQLNTEVAERLHRMFGAALGFTVHDFADRALDFCGHSISHLAVLEPTESSKVILQCCVLNQFKLVLSRFEDAPADPTLERYCDVLQAVTDGFFDSIRRGYHVNVKRAGDFAKPTVARAVIRVEDGIFDITYLQRNSNGQI